MENPTAHLGLLVIDLQDTFLKAIPNADQLIARNCFAIKAAKLLGCAIAVTEQLPEKLGASNQTILDCLPKQTPIFDKTGFSAFDAEGLSRWIETNQIEHLLVAGIESTICIYQTAVHALSEDIGVTLLADCISERRPEDRASVFNQLLKMEAHVLPSETIFYSLLGSAEHPAFKEMTALVKGQ